ncbi:hypothetical protein M6B38_267060 [Iris pallida]|uniref:Uncharacterized protein n=1 Tax=Iris pallida TaxID=29817 RepID=A0AAX6I929_IRIPA|nr:hypothetical protein M6B38_267060 [Iris pallida]
MYFVSLFLYNNLFSIHLYLCLHEKESRNDHYILYLPPIIYMCTLRWQVAYHSLRESYEWWQHSRDTL